MSTNRQFLDVERRRTRVPSLTVTIVAFMVVLAALMMLHQRSRAENVVSPIEVLLGTPPGPSGEILAVTEGPVTVYVPPDATTQEGRISINLASPDQSLVADNSGWIRPQVVNIEFQDPGGTTLSDIAFSSPLEICFNLTADEWRDFEAQTDAYQVQHFASQADPPGWEPLPGKTYPARRQVCGQTTHLSLFSLAIKREPVVTGPTGSNPGISTLVPTRTPISVEPTREPRRDGASSEGGLGPGPASPTARPVPPTNPPPTNPPPTPVPTQQPTEPPAPTATNPPEEPTATEAPTEPTATEVPTEASGLLDPILELIVSP
jgi:hypothetical protein